MLGGPAWAALPGRPFLGGNPYPLHAQNPCRAGSSTPNFLNQEAIEVQIAGVGNAWDPNVIDCLVDDPGSQIHNITAFDATDVFPSLSVTAPAGIVVIPALGWLLLRRRRDVG